MLYWWVSMQERVKLSENTTIIRYNYIAIYERNKCWFDNPHFQQIKKFQFIFIHSFNNEKRLILLILQKLNYIGLKVQTIVFCGKYTLTANYHLSLQTNPETIVSNLSCQQRLQFQTKWTNNQNSWSSRVFMYKLWRET